MATRTVTAKPREQRTVAAIGEVRGGLGQMLAQAGGDSEIVKAAEMVESIPGGMELLYTMAGEELIQKAGGSPKDAKKVRLYNMGGAVELAEGGPARAAAEKTRAAGRGDDSIMLHMSPEEYEVITSMWGEPEVNPNTGIGEYGFLSKVWKKVKGAVKKIFKSKIFQVVAPIALSIFAPGLGTAIGGALGAGATAAPIIGNALIQGGLSAAGGGDFVKGAVSGAITGGLGKVAGAQVSKIAPGISDQTAAVIGSGLAGGAASSVTGGDFMEGAVMGGLGEYMRPTMEGLVSKGQEAFGIQDPGAGGILAVGQPEYTGSALDTEFGSGLAPGEMGPPAPSPFDPSSPTFVGPPGPAPGAPGTAPAPAAGGPLAGLGQYALPALMAAGAYGSGDYEEAQRPELPPHMMESLPVYTMNRQFRQLPDPTNYYTYGQAGAPQSGQHLFLQPDPFAGEAGSGHPLAPPAGGLAQMIASGQPIPPQVAGADAQNLLSQGYTQDPATGNWLPPLGLAPGQATGGYMEQADDIWSESPSVSAQGRYVKGPGTGRSDDIEARLSDGEYVMDAESVALLGDGSGDAGARRLDEMRRNLRKHKSEKLRKGGFSHKAKEPHKYMSGGGMARLRAAAGAA